MAAGLWRNISDGNLIIGIGNATQSAIAGTGLINLSACTPAGMPKVVLPPCSTLRYWLKSQIPVRVSRGLQVFWAIAVGTVKRFVVPLVSRVA